MVLAKVNRVMQEALMQTLIHATPNRSFRDQLETMKSKIAMVVYSERLTGHYQFLPAGTIPDTW